MTLMPDSTTVKGHQHASGAKKELPRGNRTEQMGLDNWAEERGGVMVIPSRVNAKHPRNTDWHTYEERHLVENLFLKLKNNRRFATSCEKKALYFRAVVCIAYIGVPNKL